jgi:hypothetical protein
MFVRSASSQAEARAQFTSFVIDTLEFSLSDLSAHAPPGAPKSFRCRKKKGSLRRAKAPYYAQSRPVESKRAPPTACKRAPLTHGVMLQGAARAEAAAGHDRTDLAVALGRYCSAPTRAAGCKRAALIVTARNGRCPDSNQ